MNNYKKCSKDEGFFEDTMKTTVMSDVKAILSNHEEAAIRAKVSCRDAGVIAALSAMAGVTIDVSPVLFGREASISYSYDKGSVEAYIQGALNELARYINGGEYQPLKGALDALKKRVEQEILKIEGFLTEDGEFRFIDTNGITSVTLEDGKVLVRGRFYRLEPDPDDEEEESVIAYPEL